MYFDYAGGQVRTDGNNAGDGRLPPIARSWGPPGFAIPEGGAPPSSPR
jgi:hypothetical protein